MKTIADFRTDTLTLLGDASGRRYSNDVLDMAIREALSVTMNYHPRHSIVTESVAQSVGREIVLNWMPPAGGVILNIRNASGDLLHASDYQDGTHTILQFYGSGTVPAAGDELSIELALPHTIQGLDSAASTTVPDDLALTVCSGAAGYAMRIRARSVTEVFGKRPEDTERLIEQAEMMIRIFLSDLEIKYLGAYYHKDPWPLDGFPI